MAWSKLVIDCENFFLEMDHNKVKFQLGKLMDLLNI